MKDVLPLWKWKINHSSFSIWGATYQSKYETLKTTQHKLMNSFILIRRKKWTANEEIGDT